MQYLNNKLCLTYDELVPEIVTESYYKLLKFRKQIVVHGIGGNGRIVLIEFETIPIKYKKIVKEKYGDPYIYVAKQPILNSIEWDLTAQRFYHKYKLPSGLNLPNSSIDLDG